MSAPAKPKGPDLTKGVPLADIPDGGVFAGHAHGVPALIARQGAELFAVGSTCAHYGGPLAEGLVVGDTIRCPWHHACFSLRTGEPLRAPAFKPVACWEVSQRDGKAFVGRPVKRAKPRPPGAPAAAKTPKSIVIIGGGCAGNFAAETLRHEGYAGRITMLSADAAIPCDRPNLSKSFLAGAAPASWIPLRSRRFYSRHEIDLRLDARVAAISPAERTLQLANGRTLGYDALLLATGADPVHLPLPGGDLPHVRYLRTVADSRAIIKRALESRRAVVIGASFIGLEVAASLRARGLDVHVVAPEPVPMERILGADVGKAIQKLHEEHGVRFHLGATAAAIDAERVTLASGESLAADLVVLGVGVRPSIALAEQAGLATDRGVTVNEFLETSAAGVFAAGDIARWPDALTGERIRVEHWVVAARQGRTAALNLLGRRERFDAVPFFWSEHYDMTLAYVGHAERWDAIEIDGEPERKDCTITFKLTGRTLAVATIFRDRESLLAEVALERRIAELRP